MRINDQEFNRLTVLKAIRRAEPIARTELAGLTGLSGGTITELTGDLVRRQVIIEEKVAAQGRGRPRVQLRMNPQGAHMVGAFLSNHGGLTVEIINLRGDSVFAKTSKMPPTTTIAALAEAVATIIDATIAASPFRKSDLHRVGVTLPAILDNIRGVVYFFVTYPAQPTPVADIIEKRLQLPVVIDNSVNVMARAEHWFSKETHVDDFSLISLDLGIGSARYVAGMLSAGAHGINPELGHMKVAFEHERRCYCGGSGCVASYCTIWGIANQICELRGREPPTLAALMDAYREFVSDARNGDAGARAIFDQAGRLLGTAMASHINASDPGKLIILIFDPFLSDMISVAFHAALKHHTLPALYERTAIELRTIEGDDLMWKGSAALVLEQIYRLPQEPGSMQVEAKSRQ